jgi:hypothetical protein
MMGVSGQRHAPAALYPREIAVIFNKDSAPWCHLVDKLCKINRGVFSANNQMLEDQVTTW